MKDEELKLSSKIPAWMREVDLGFQQDLGFDLTIWELVIIWNLSWRDPGAQMGTEVGFWRRMVGSAGLGIFRDKTESVPGCGIFGIERKDGGSQAWFCSTEGAF